jgi:hypothetical protein
LWFAKAEGLRRFPLTAQQFPPSRPRVETLLFFKFQRTFCGTFGLIRCSSKLPEPIHALRDVDAVVSGLRRLASGQNPSQQFTWAALPKEFPHRYNFRGFSDVWFYGINFNWISLFQFCSTATRLIRIIRRAPPRYGVSMHHLKINANSFLHF